jgi:arginase
VLGVPSSAGGRRLGQERGPSALRDAGLVEALRARAGAAEVLDAGDLPVRTFAPDAVHPARRNLPAVVETVRSVRERVRELLAAGYFPVVLGGDCTITVGVVAAFVERHGDPGLIYFDADLDLNTPETTPSGIFDGMVTAHLLGQGAPQLAGAGPRRPLLPPSRLLYFGYDVAGGGIDPPELAALERSQCPCVPSADVRRDPTATARAALARLAGDGRAILVHFDVDTLDTRAVDVPHANGLRLDTAMESLSVFLGSGAAGGLVVTELNPAMEADGATAAALAAALPNALGAAASPRLPR